jgi:hypothetical protein
MKARVLNLTNREMRALRDEIDRQTAENVEKLSQNLQALILWQLREQLGWGKKRLLRFQKRFIPAIRELQDYYMTSSADETDYICNYKLKHELGIDVAELDELFAFKVRIYEGDRNG